LVRSHPSAREKRPFVLRLMRVFISHRNFSVSIHYTVFPIRYPVFVNFFHFVSSSLPYQPNQRFDVFYCSYALPGRLRSLWSPSVPSRSLFPFSFDLHDTVRLPDGLLPLWLLRLTKRVSFTLHFQQNEVFLRGPHCFGLNGASARRRVSFLTL